MNLINSILSYIYSSYKSNHHGVISTRQLAKVKHEVRKTMLLTGQLVKINGWRVIILVLLGLIIMRKDISINFNLKTPTHNEQGQPMIMPVNVTSELTSRAVSVPKRSRGAKVPAAPVRVPQFSNIAFILNPTYAKRNNISPKIVAEKRQICVDYVQRFGDVAVADMKKYGIPASITLAQGLLESDAGQSRLAKESNNHFGIKCFEKNCKPGHCTNHSDDSHKDFFRKYTTVWESYRAHSLFLHRSRYQHLLKIPSTDYKSWANGLSKAGYATDKKYADKLTTLIETLKLYKYDKK